MARVHLDSVRSLSENKQRTSQRTRITIVARVHVRTFSDLKYIKHVYFSFFMVAETGSIPFLKIQNHSLVQDSFSFHFLILHVHARSVSKTTMYFLVTFIVYTRGLVFFMARKINTVFIHLQLCLVVVYWIYL